LLIFILFFSRVLKFVDVGLCTIIGGYDKEEKAARAYDLAALKYWGTTTTTNFPVSKFPLTLLICSFLYYHNHNELRTMLVFWH